MSRSGDRSLPVACRGEAPVEGMGTSVSQNPTGFSTLQVELWWFPVYSHAAHL